VRSSLPAILVDRPEGFDTLEIWQSFLAELEAMPDFEDRDIEWRTAKRMVAKKSAKKE
jgi:hypothetical protein